MKTNKMRWTVTCLACCSFLVCSVSAFAITIANPIDLEPGAESYFQIDETGGGGYYSNMGDEEVYYSQELHYNVYNYSSNVVTAFAVGVQIDSHLWDYEEFYEDSYGPAGWQVGLATQETLDEWEGSGLDEDEGLNYIWDAGYEFAFLAYVDEGTAIGAYTGIENEFEMIASTGGFMPSSPAVVLAGGTLYTGGTSNDPNYGGNIRLPSPVPEPATMLLFGTGLAGLVGMRRRKAKK